MSKKNLNDTMFSMFGVSKEEEMGEVAVPAAEKETKTSKPVIAPVAPKAQNSVTHLAAGSTMEGKLQTEGDVEIDCTFNGNVVAKGKVILRSNMQGDVTAASLQLLGCTLVGNVFSEGSVLMDRDASVVGNISAGELISSGRVQGDLEIKGNVALNECASVEGDISTRTMTMSQGAVITGGVKMGAK